MENEKITHLDLFSGIGGFAYAVDNVFGNAEHIFCDSIKELQKIMDTAEGVVNKLKEKKL